MYSALLERKAPGLDGMRCALVLSLVHLRGPESQAGNAFNIFSIASITFANGADNVGAYVPFFAVSSEYVLWILACYVVLLPIWCLSADGWENAQSFCEPSTAMVIGSSRLFSSASDCTSYLSVD